MLWLNTVDGFEAGVVLVVTVIGGAAAQAK